VSIKKSSIRYANTSYIFARIVYCEILKRKNDTQKSDCNIKNMKNARFSYKGHVTSDVTLPSLLR